MIIHLRIGSLAMLGLVAAGAMSAQALRTWVSGVGDDANPCSRTAPCHTFAGTISKTAAGGEIDVLDPGDFGPLTVSKAIKIDGAVANASSLAAGVDGFVINAGANDTVVLRNLSINGFTSSPVPDSRGIKFLAGKELVVENCEVMNFSKRNISIESSTPNAIATIINTTVHDGGGNGIAVVPPPGVTNQVVLDDVRVVGNGSFGVAVAAGGVVDVRNSTLSNNTVGGVWVSFGTVSLSSSLISGNALGLNASNSANVTLNKVSLVANGTGATFGGATLVSFGNNQMTGNTNVNTLAASSIAAQ